MAAALIRTADPGRDMPSPCWDHEERIRRLEGFRDELRGAGRLLLLLTGSSVLTLGATLFLLVSGR